MPGKRPIKKGSFGGHFEELVKHFPHDARDQRTFNANDKRSLQEKRDIHALLFERAWQLEQQDEGSAT